MKNGMIDCHMHTLYNKPDFLKVLADKYGYDKYAILGCPCMGDVLNNLECFYCKSIDKNRAYVFGGMTYFGDALSADGSDFKKQLELMMAAGADGIKMLETKPNYQRDLGIRIDSERYDQMFDMANVEGLPIIWHVGDPADNWDISKATPFAIEHGYCYASPGDPTLDEIYESVENVLNKYKNLKACFAHFYFVSDDMDHARRLFDTYPNVMFDLTPGTEMYGDFLRDRPKWQAFFEAYQDRIMYGTDLSDDVSEEESGLNDILVGLVHKMVRGEKQFTVWDFHGDGFDLSESIQNKIYYKNFERFAGSTPKSLNQKGLEALEAYYIERLKANGLQGEIDRCRQLFSKIMK